MPAMIQLMVNTQHGRRFDYASMELDLVTPLRITFKGPEYYRHPVMKKLFKQARAKAEKLQPLAQIPGST